MSKTDDNKRILLHTCCAPCATGAVERLILEGCEVALFFSNSNISPESEYEKRLESARSLAKILNLPLEEDIYDHDSWLSFVKGLEGEPERGARCGKCFKYSLKRTAEAADRLNYPAFATTLTISPHKISKMIFDAGSEFPKYKPFDFKKKDGFKRSLELARKHKLYRQNYCGCEFSAHQKS